MNDRSGRHDWVVAGCTGVLYGCHGMAAWVLGQCQTDQVIRLFDEVI